MLQADSIRKSYRGRNVLSSASLNSARGTVTALVGRMGAGKSTLLRVCAGLVVPEAGWVKFNGAQSDRPRLHEMSRSGMYFMGERSGLAESLTVQQHLDLFGARYGVSIGEDLVDSFSFRELMSSKPQHLSSGERRRAELMIAIARNPSCLIMDEPFRELDPMTRESIGSGVRSLASRGCAVVMSGHEVTTILHYCDSVTWVTSGTTYDLGRPDQASRDERFVREFLGTNSV
jgi:lipopolysaccharide export system ATP-binding protein